ncbi:MAG: hypothetical protein H6553_10650 [Chitinophagales bacterium]|nr:hypothetical protein [Chitinophagales bacterium]
MQELELTKTDKAILKQDINISFIVGFVFCVALFILVIVGPILFVLFGYRPADNFVSRGLFTLGLFFILFIAVSWKNILKFVDIKRGKKLVIETTDYEIKKTKNSVLLRLKDNENRTIEIWEELLPLIDISRPLKIDIAILSKTIIFISHNNKNLLDD